MPGTGTPEPDRGFWVRLGAAAGIGLLVGAFLLTRIGGEDAGPAGTVGASTSSTSTPRPGSTSPGPASSTAPPPPVSSTPPPSPSPTRTQKPPTLAFTVRYASYITVRVPGGRVLVSRLFKKGDTAAFDAKVLEVTNGRPNAVRFVVNGKPHKPGPADRPETFTVRRR